ncbi:hypothetical protein AB0M28_38735 [Streptomyces sp. NPDC051940]|uniref:DUF6153 family protein n=1 Tax=Streptomyces sp. NPDC051940 TaxID=3155675 RepID=UPI003441AEB1
MSTGWSRAGGVIGRFLFVAVLALGVVVMHSTGHPDDSSTRLGGMAHAAAAHSSAMPAAAVSPAAESGPHGPATEPGSGTHDPAAGMDMAALCLAVLGPWAFAALLRAAFARSGTRPAKRLAHADAALRRGPPPRPPDLTRLSVLRI